MIPPAARKEARLWPVLGRDVEPITDTPLGVVDLLDGAFAAIRHRARVIVGVAVVPVLPAAVFQAWVARDDLGGAALGDLFTDPTVSQEAADPFAAYDLLFLVSQTVALLVTAVGGVAVSRVVGGWLDGEDRGVAEAWRFTLRRLGPVLGAFVVIHLVQAVGFVLAVVPGLVAVVAFSLTSPVLALEGRGAIDSMRRSATLVRRRPGPVVGVIVLLAIVHQGVDQAVSTLPEGVALVIGPDRAWPLLAAANAATSIILVPVTGAAMCLLYLDIRYRTEGVDLRRRINRQFGPSPQMPSSQGPWP